MKTKKIVILLCSIVSTGSYSESYINYDFLSFDDDLVDYSQEIAQLVSATRAPSCDFSTQDLVNIAVDNLNFPTLLQYNAYKHTNPPVVRSLHDLPSLRPWYGCDDALCFYATFFYNQMFHAYFTHCGTYLKDYLAIAQEDALVAELENLIPFIPQILPLFNVSRLQYRRLGAMLGGSKCFGNLRLNMAIPLYYSEFNFYLTQKQVDALNSASFFGGDQPIPDSDLPQNQGFSIVDPNTFIERHMLSDQIGFGDLRLYADYLLCEESRCPIRIGGQLTLPNNTVIRRSIMGSTFNICYPGPGLSIEEFLVLQCLSDPLTPDPVSLDAKNELAALAQSFALNFIDRLSATVLQNSLSQRQVSYGFLTEFFVRLTDYTNLCLFFEWDQFIKGHEDRPVRLALTPSQSLERDYENAALAQDNLTFLQQRFNNILFPPTANIIVKQGDIIKARIYSQTQWRVLQWNIGYDLWYQCKERIFTCNTCAAPVQQLDIESAEKPAALQNKIFGGCTLQRNAESYESFGWRLGLKGEVTCSTYGIGKDWLVGVDFVADF